MLFSVPHLGYVYTVQFSAAQRSLCWLTWFGQCYINAASWNNLVRAGMFNSVRQCVVLRCDISTIKNIIKTVVGSVWSVLNNQRVILGYSCGWSLRETSGRKARWQMLCTCLSPTGCFVVMMSFRLSEVCRNMLVVLALLFCFPEV